MKRLMIFLILLASAFGAFAANPAFTDFNASQFGTAGNKVIIRGDGVTNGQGNIFVAMNKLDPTQFFTNGGTVTIKAAFTNSVILFVDPNGNDSTAQRGIPSLPWKTPTNAVKSAQFGDTVFLNPGLYTITNTLGLQAPPGVNILANLGTVTICNLNTNGRIGVAVSSNAVISGLIITNGFNNFCMAAIGLHDAAGNGNATGFVIQNCLLQGDCDVVHFATTNNWSGIVQDCRIGYKDDGIANSGVGSNPTFWCTNLDVYPLGPPTDGQPQNAVSIGSNVKFIADNSYFYASNGAGAGSCTIASLANSSLAFNNCTIAAPPGSNSFLSTENSGVSITLNYCRFDPTDIFTAQSATYNIWPLIDLTTNISILPIHDFADHDLTLNTWSSGDAITTFTFGGNGNLSIPNGVKTLINNKSAPTTITVGASVFNYTNTQPVNIQVFIDANGGTTAVTMNGSAIFGALVGGDHAIILQPGDRIGVTYSVATPVMKYREF